MYDADQKVRINIGLKKYELIKWINGHSLELYKYCWFLWANVSVANNEIDLHVGLLWHKLQKVDPKSCSDAKSILPPDKTFANVFKITKGVNIQCIYIYLIKVHLLNNTIL